VGKRHSLCYRVFLRHELCQVLGMGNQLAQTAHGPQNALDATLAEVQPGGKFVRHGVADVIAEVLGELLARTILEFCCQRIEFVHRTLKRQGNVPVRHSCHALRRTTRQLNSPRCWPASSPPAAGGLNWLEVWPELVEPALARRPRMPSKPHTSRTVPIAISAVPRESPGRRGGKAGGVALIRRWRVGHLRLLRLRAGLVRIAAAAQYSWRRRRVARRIRPRLQAAARVLPQADDQHHQAGQRNTEQPDQISRLNSGVPLG